MARSLKLTLLALAVVAAIPATYYGYQFYLRGNFAVVVPGQVYRSAQPSPSRLESWSKEYGLECVLNLRGETYDGFDAEQATAERLGMQVLVVRLSAREPPTALAVRELIDHLENAPRPMLIHCQAGADRAGVVSVLAAMAVGGQDYDTARSQLTWRYFHLGLDSVRVNELLDKYEKWCESTGRTTGGWEQFRAWASTEYYPDYFRVRIDQIPERLTLPAGQSRPLTVRVTNTADTAIPVGNSEKVFRLACFEGSSEHDSPDRELATRVGLPQRDLGPGESVELKVYLRAPKQPGELDVHFDLVEEHRTWFGRQGSPVPTVRMIVTAP